MTRKISSIHHQPVLPVFEKPAAFAEMERRSCVLGTSADGVLCWFDADGTIIRPCHDHELAFTYSQNLSHQRVSRGAMILELLFEQPSSWAL